MKKILVLVIFIVINLLSFYYYSTLERNDLFFAIITFILPFFESVIIYRTIKVNAMFLRRSFLYFELLFFSCYLILMSALNLVNVEGFHYEMQTVLLITILLSIVSIFIYFKRILQQK